jgi:TolB protein
LGIAPLIASLIALLALVACSQTPPLPPLLVLGGDSSIKVVDEEGTALDLLTPDARIAANQPTWAPDGRLAVWTEIDRSNGEARIAMGDDRSQRRLDGGTAPFFYAWSPDGEHISYLGNAPDGSGVAMGLVDVAAGTAGLVDSGAPYYLDWSPDSARLAVHVGNQDLAFVDLDGNREDIEIETGFFQAPAFLPDGRLVIARAGDEPGLALVEAGESVLLTSLDAVTSFAPDPAGNRVAYTDNTDAVALGSLFIVGVDGSDPITVTEGPVVAFQWAPTGDRLLFINLDVEALNLVPSVWDDGTITEFEALIPTSVFLNDYLPFWDQYARVLSVWSGEGDQFALPVADPNGGGIQIYDVASGTNRRLIDGTFASWSSP